MKTGEASAQERLDFLREQRPPSLGMGCTARDANLHGDPMGVGSRIEAMNERLKLVEEMDRDLRTFKASWTQGPQADEVKEAGTRLISHLQGFVHETRGAAGEDEVETLASLWRWDPDVNSAYSLPTPNYYKPHQVWGSLDHEETAAEELKSAYAAIKEEITAEIKKEVASKEAAPPQTDKEQADFEKDDARTFDGLSPKTGWPDDLRQAFKEGVGNDIGTEQEEIETEKGELEEAAIKVPVVTGGGGGRPGKFDEYRIVGKVSDRSPESEPKAPETSEEWKKIEAEKDKLEKVGIQVPVNVDGRPRGKPKLAREPRAGLDKAPREKEELEDELDMLDVKSWTDAINEVLLSSWVFERQLRGRIGDRARMGVTLRWKKGSSKLHLDIERLDDDEVLVRLVPPRSSDYWSQEGEERMYRVHAKEMKESDLRELHRDPRDFVKKVLLED